MSAAPPAPPACVERLLDEGTRNHTVFLELEYRHPRGVRETGCGMYSNWRQFIIWNCSSMNISTMPGSAQFPLSKTMPASGRRTALPRLFHALPRTRRRQSRRNESEFRNHSDRQSPQKFQTDFEVGSRSRFRTVGFQKERRLQTLPGTLETILFLPSEFLRLRIFLSRLKRKEPRRGVRRGGGVASPQKIFT